MTKFKVGDRVRVVRTGLVGWEIEDWCKVAFQQAGINYPEGVAEIRELRNDDCVKIVGSSYNIDAGHFERVVDDLCGKCNPAPVEPPPTRFILQYELDKDPFENFATMKEVEARIKELSLRSDLKRESIKVYEIAKTYDVSLETRVIFNGLLGPKVRMNEKKTKQATKVECTECGRKFINLRGLAIHLSRSH